MNLPSQQDGPKHSRKPLPVDVKMLLTVIFSLVEPYFTSNLAINYAEPFPCYHPDMWGSKEIIVIPNPDVKSITKVIIKDNYND